MKQYPAVRVSAEHAPVDGLHVPAVWQESLAAGQVLGAVVCVQVPAEQVEMPLHALPSSLQRPLSLWLDHALVVISLLHAWHGLPEFTVPFATHVPSMKQ
jgi:hypothetical protein